MARPPRDPKTPSTGAKTPARRGADPGEKRAKSPAAAARDARRAQHHAQSQPPRPAATRAEAPAAPPARDLRRPNAAARINAAGRVTKPKASGGAATDRRPPAARSDRPFPPARADRPERPARPDRSDGPDRGARRPSGVAGAAPIRAPGDRPRRPAGLPSAGGPARPARAPFGRRPDDPYPDRAATGRPDRPERGERPAFATRADRAGAPTRAAPKRGAARHERPPAAPRNPAESAPGEGQRIAKLLARAGIASRREIERMIEDGRVAIGGVPIDTAATILRSLHGVTVDGNPVQAAAPTRLFRYHKPPGLLTAERDPAGRVTIYDRLPPGLPRLIPVGRLDLNTEGLLLLTTDGELKRQLELPATGVERTYRARVFGDVSQAQLEELIDGIEIEGVRYGQIDANLERRTGRNGWVEMKLREGKNREVRRVLEYLGLQVSRLIRTAYGPFTLEDMQPGDVDEVRQHDLVAFRKLLK